jgi:hypothetical protein
MSLILTAAKLALVTKAVVAACDDDDGLKDGLVERELTESISVSTG